MPQTTNFLGAERTVTAEIPDGFDQFPHLRTAIGDKRTWRQLSFFPSPRFDHPSRLDYMRPVDRVSDADGKQVEVYEQRQQQPVRIAAWDVPNGFATAAFNPGAQGDLGRVVGSLALRTSLHGLPQLMTFGSDKVHQDPIFPSRRDLAMFSAGVDGSLDCLTFAYMPGGVKDADDGYNPHRAIQISYVDDVKVAWSTTRANAATLPDRFQAFITSVSLG